MVRTRENRFEDKSKMDSNKHHFYEMIDPLPVATYITDAEGRLTHFNRAAIEFSGRVPELGTDRCITRKLFYPDGTPMPYEESPMAVALKEGRSVFGEEAVAERPDGTRIAALAYATPIHDASGKLIGAVNIAVDIGKRKRAEEALHKTREQFEMAARAGSVGTWTWDIKENIVTADEYLAEAYGVDPETASAGASMELFYEPIHEEDEEKTWNRLMKAVKETGALEAEYRIRNEKGEILWVFARGKVEYDKGEPVRMRGTISDITERKEAEEELSKSREQLATDLNDSKLLQSFSTQLIEEENVEVLYEKIIDAAVAIMDSEYASIQMLHPERGDNGELRLLAFKGFNPEAAEFWKWVTPASESTCGLAMKTGERIVVPDVENCSFMEGTEDQATYLQTGIHAVQTTPLVSRNGQMLGMISTHWKDPHEPSERKLRLLDILARQASDIIEQKQSVEALSKSEERFRTIVNQTIVGVVQTEAEGNMTLVNQHWCDMLGYNEEELLGKNILDVTHPESKEGTLNAVKELAAGASDFTIEKRYQRKDGSVMWASSSVNAMCSGSGEYQGLVAVVSNITESKKREERDQYLLKLNDTLRPLASPDEIKQEATQLLGEHLNVNRALYAEADADGEYVVIKRDYTDGTSSMAGRIRLDDFGPALMNEMRVGDTHIATRIPDNPQLTKQEKKNYQGIDIQAQIGVPLVKNGKLVAILGVHQNKPRDWTGQEKALVEETAERTWAAVERARAEETLAESEEQFRAFVTASSDVVYRMSADWTEMYHLEGRDFIADTTEPSSTWLDEYIHLDDQKRVKKAINEAIETKSVFELEHRVRQVDGTLGWTHSRAIPILDDNGEIIEWFGAARDVTERKKAEEALAQVTAESERQRRLYETIFSSTPDFACVFDLDYRIIYANDALLNLWGRTEEGTVGKKLSELGFESERTEMRKREINRVIETKQTVRGEASLTHSKLGKRVYDYIFVPVLNSKGEVEAVAGTTRDITEFKQHENDLRESEGRLDLAAELVNLGTWRYDPEVNLVYLNERMRTIWGEPEDAESISLPEVLARIHPDDREYVSEAIQLALDPDFENDFYNVDYRIVLDDGTERWITANGQVEFRGEGPERKPVEFFGTAIDITGRKKKQEEREQLLREVETEQERLLDIFQYAPSVMAILRGPDHVHEHANEMYKQILGQREVIEKPIREVLPEFEGQGFFELLDEVYETGETYVGTDERVMLTSQTDGSLEEYYMNFVYQPIRDSDGSITGVFVQGVDLTERKRAEEELKAVNENLEEKVEERTTSLLSYQEQLRLLANRLSNAEEEERRRLAAELHDNLGQMLALTKMKVDLMQKTGNLSDIAETSEMIDEALVYTRELMSDLKPPPSLGKEDINATLDWLTRKMKKYNLNVTFDGVEQPEALDEDVQTTLVQTVRELLFNVIKHTDTGEARVALSYPDDHLKIVIEDDGAGFDADKIDPDLSKGGFGLFNIRERIDLLGGQTEIISEPGSGTRVSLLVPLTAESASTLPYGQGTQEKQEQSGRQGKQKQDKIKVLLVDDHEMMREGLKKIIDSEDDLTVLAEAPDGRQAIKLAHETQPDIIIMDINLPGMNGIDATRNIKSELPEMCIIGLSLHNDEKVEREMRDVGASAYLSKSDAFETLCATIRSEAINQKK